MHKRRVVVVGFSAPILSAATMARAVKIEKAIVVNGKPNTNFYQTKIQRRKKGDKINFR